MARCRKDGCEDQPNTRLKFDAGRIAATDALGRRRGVLSFQDGHPGEAPACAAPFGGVGRPRGRAAPGMPVPGFDRMTPVADVFACFEAHGLRPFPSVEGWDSQIAIDRLNACLAVPPDLVEAVSPDPRIGINNPALHFEADKPRVSSDDNARTTDKYNYPPNVMFDLARLGVGTLRHLQDPDLAWFHLIGNDVPIAPPGAMRDLLANNGWAVFGKFTYAVITCLYTGQRLIPLIFGAGGGSSTAVQGVDTAKPSFQRSAFIPVDAGWDEWYWDLGLGDGRAEWNAQWYQRFALNLVPREEPFADYHLECCYRKCLGLLTFARLVGEYLVLLAAAIEDCSGGTVALRDIVPAIECGNETDVFYVLSDPEHRTLAAREFGRYHALLAGPIMAQGLGLRARLGETFFWVRRRADWDDTVRWLRETITLGVVEEVARWHLVAVYPAADPLWSRLAGEADWNWWTTPGASCAGDLVHEIGFHSFTWKDSTASIYRPETDFSDEAAELVDEVARDWSVMAALGHSLEWSCCVGFQGSRPSNPRSEDEYFAENTLAHQGGMVARRMLAACSQPTQPTQPTFVTWYASMGGLTLGDRIWDLYASSGVRNVLFEGRKSAVEILGPLPGDEESFECRTHAWPRPAWYTLRRVAWLLARASRVERVYQSGFCGAMAVRLVAREGFHDPLAPAMSAVVPDRPRSYRYAYVAWLDGTRAAAVRVPSWVIELESDEPVVSAMDRLWVVLPLVPTVDCGSDSSPPPTDSLGFAGAVSVDWNATPQDSRVTESWTSGVDTLRIVVHRSDPSANPAPICVLCDHEVVGLYLLPDVAGLASLEMEEVAGTLTGGPTPRNPIQGAPKRPG